jgi:hypothetical protein
MEIYVFVICVAIEGIHVENSLHSAGRDIFNYIGLKMPNAEIFRRVRRRVTQQFLNRVPDRRLQIALQGSVSELNHNQFRFVRLSLAHALMYLLAQSCS